MRYKKILAILMILTLLIPSLTFLVPEKVNASTTYNSSNIPEYSINEAKWEEDKALYGIPLSTLYKTGNGLKFNLRLWADKGLKVYGNYTNLNSDFNRFKKVVDGYYEKNGVRGEYEYHGFTYDINPQPYTNTDFPNDVDSGRKSEDNEWVYLPWDEGLENEQSIWNRNTGKFPAIANWINEGLDFEIQYSTVEPDHIQKYEVNYLNILEAPSTRDTGEGKMWNLGRDGKTYYQNFSVKQIEFKEDTPLETELDILNDELILQADQDSFKLKVDFLATLKDEAIYNNLLNSTIYYNREDIDHWEFTLNTVSKNQPHTDIVLTKPNAAKAYYEIVIPRATLEANPEYTLTGTVKLYFENGDNLTAPVSKKVDIAVISGLTSYFSISQTIEIANTSSFSSSQINYIDGSFGEIIQYEIAATDGVNGDFATFNQTSASSVNQYLYNYISPILAELNAPGDAKSFTVTQTVFDDKGNTDSFARTVTIKIAENAEYVYVDPNVDIPARAFDIVAFKPKDYTDTSSYAARYVYVDGQQVSDSLFFSGNYVFGLGKHGLRNILVKYISTTGEESITSAWVSVYNTKPYVQFKVDGSYKENRKMAITNDSVSANDPYVYSNFPINNYTWSFSTIEGESVNFKLNDISDLYKEFLSKGTGTYHVTLVGTNTLGRVSDPYELDITIIEDYPPAVEANIWNNVLARNEQLKLTYSASSTDGDLIASSVMEIYYDADNDGTIETLLETYNTEEFSEFTPTELGNYKVIITATEEFGEETLPEYVDETDRRTKTLERDFFVDNYRPVTELYIDIPIDMPNVDVFFMTDKNLERTKNDYIIANKMNLSNDLLLENIIPNISTWDMHTYLYEQPASTTKNTGTSYPSSSTYYSSGGYSGTLYRYKVVDNGYWVPQSHTETETAYETFNGTHDNTVTTKGTLSPYKETYRYESSPAPSSKYISSNGYSGSIPRKNTDRISDSYSTNEATNSWSRTSTWRAYYSGTLSKQVTVTVQDPDKWVSSYRGYYSGTIYKNVRQVYSNPFITTSYKYLVYVADDIINEINDLNMVLGNADTNLILIGNSNITSQVANYDLFIQNNGQPIEELVNQAMAYIKTANQVDINKLTTLVGQSFNISSADLDLDGDSITEEKYQIVHNPNYYDNSQGLASNAYTSYADSQFTVSTAPTSFSKAGEYTIYRRIKDIPSTDPNFADYAMYSGSRALKIYVHRKPIASAILDWDYDPSQGTYLTSWIDNSYDPDHQYSDPNKGIVEQNIRYSRNGGDWYYKIPDKLTAGTYVVEYRVKDLEGAWSDPWTMNFTLATEPGIQILDAKLKTADPQFSINSIPASENLIIYDVLTRFPYTTYLDVAIYQGATKKTTSKIVNFTEGITGNKTANDISWNEISYTIPAALADGSYTVKVTAVGTNGKTAAVDLPFNANTPVNLQIVDFPTEMTSAGAPVYQIQAATSKYVNQVQVTIYQGTAYQHTLDLAPTATDGSVKSWSLEYTVPPNIPEYNYLVEYYAKTTNNKTQTAQTATTVRVMYLIPSVYHPILWDEERIEAGRPQNMFLAGERFMLYAETPSTVNAVQVTVDFGYEIGKYTVNLNPSENNTKWNGELWEEDFKYIEEGPYTFTFAGIYSDGSKVENVEIIIDGNVYTGLGVHRVK